MKILHIVEDFSIKSGGLRTVVNNLNLELQNSGFLSYILSSDKEKEDSIYLVEAKNTPWMYSKEWKNKIKDIVNEKNIDIIHIHGVWLYPQYIASKYAIQNKIPFVLSVHGMYEPWLWQQGTLKKKIYFHLLVKKIFLKAAIIHTITPFETENIKTLLKTSKIEEIPNLIHSQECKLEVNSKQKYILYLGRLDEKKGIKMLIEAFSKLKKNTFYLKIAGKNNDYKIELEKIICQLQLDNRVSFLGMIKGSDKVRLIKEAFVLVAPSYSEVIGMVNLEAAILKTPVITTYQTGLDAKWDENGGKLINPNTKELTNVLDEVLNWSFEERKKNGEKLHHFVKRNYSWKNRTTNWLELYKKAINN